MLGNLRGSGQDRSQAVALARRYGIAGLESRAVGIDASARTDDGDLWAAWRENRDVLARVEQSALSAYRVHQCLANYAASAELWGWRAAGYQFDKAAADSLRGTPNRITEGANRARAAAMALAARLEAEYREEARRAEDLLGAAPESETRTRYLNSMRLLEGESYLLAGRPGDAARVLGPLADAAIVHREQWRAHQILGLSLLRTNGRPAAVRQFEAAVDLLEHRVATAPDAAERSRARREGIEAYRNLADTLLE
jgi:hypothetical protein